MPNNEIHAVDRGALVWYWTVVELGMSTVDLTGKFDITPRAVSCSVERERKLTQEGGYRLGA